MLRVVLTIVASVLCLCAAGARAQSPEQAISESAHNALVRQLDLNGDDAEIADAAYDNFIGDWRLLEQIPFGFNQWMGAHLPASSGGDDSDLEYQLLVHWKHVVASTEHERHALEQVYFETLRSLCDDDGAATVDATVRRRLRDRWIATRHTFGEHRQASLAVDFRDIVEEREIEIDSALESSLMKWELDLHKALLRLDEVDRNERPRYVDGMVLGHARTLASSGRRTEALNLAHGAIGQVVERVTALRAVRDVQLEAVEAVARAMSPRDAQRFRIACTSLLLSNIDYQVNDFALDTLMLFEEAMRDSTTTNQQRRLLEGLLSEFAADHEVWVRRVGRQHDALFRPQTYRAYYDAIVRYRIEGEDGGDYPTLPGEAEYNEVRE